MRRGLKRRFDPASYVAGNLESARIIMANPEPWGGPDSGPAKWGAAILRAELREEEKRREGAAA